MTRVYISDLDGTLLTPDRALGERSRDAIQRFVAAGGQFTVATGRGLRSTAALLEGITLPLDIIVNNGALTADLGTGRATRVLSMQGDVALRVYREALELSLKPVAYALGPADEPLMFHAPEPDGICRTYLDSVSRYQRATVEATGEGLVAPGVRCLSFILLHRPPLLAALFARLQQLPGVTTHLGRSAYAPGVGVGEVQDGRANKAAAALGLCEAEGFSPEQIVAFGDNANDLPLMKLAGEAFCPPDSAQEVLEAVSGRIAPCAEEGVARYLEALL